MSAVGVSSSNAGRLGYAARKLKQVLTPMVAEIT